MLVIGLLLTNGRRVVTAALRMVGLEDSPSFNQYHHGLSRAVWSPLAVAQTLLGLVLDNLVGHKNPEWLIWCFQQGILPIYTPLGGSWLNMAESIQRILKRRALDGFYPKDVQTIIDRLETVARGWNAHPTPFIWNGKRRARRDRQRARRLHRVGGSGAATSRPIERLNKWRCSHQLTH